MQAAFRVRVEDHAVEMPAIIKHIKHFLLLYFLYMLLRSCLLYMHYASVVDVDPECKLLLVSQKTWINSREFVYHCPETYAFTVVSHDEIYSSV